MARLETSRDEIISEWEEDLEKNPIGSFEFSRTTPPLKNLDIAALTPQNSRRQEASSLYADISGFTAYVDSHIDSNPEYIVKALHVIRAELSRVVTTEFNGRRIRFIGDCVHALLGEGTAQTTDTDKTLSTTTLCAGGLRSSFELALEELESNGIDSNGIGLAIGYDFGPISITRLGIKGKRVRCALSRGVLASESEQQRCNGDETSLGQRAYDQAPEAVKSLFGAARKIDGLDYNEAVEALAENGDKLAKEARAEGFEAAPAGFASAAEKEIRPYTKID